MDVSRQDPLIGQVLDGRYRIESVLGEGGMGIVYKAVHTTLRKALAIKVLRPEVSKNEQIVMRFKQEAQSASQIGNQHIIDISDFGELADGSTYFVMEFLGGRSLTQALEAGKFNTERTAHVGKQLCAALGAAHEIGIVHRDMKPDNVQLVMRGDDKDFVKVLDFGIAKVGGSTSKLTQAGQVFGTPHYMSPEQCAGTNVDHRTDIYAVGVMMYEMATGKVPFDADNLMGILTKHLYENPIPPHELPPPVDVPPALEAVILKCLSKKTDTRYQSMAELQDDLEAVEAGLTPKAVVDNLQRATHASQTTSGLEAPGRLTVGQGLPGVPGKKPVGLWIGIGVALIGAGIAAAVMLGGKPDEAANVVKPIADPAPTAPVGAVPTPNADPTPPPVVAPSLVTIKSDPPGAELYRSNSLIGNTPFTLARPKDGEQIELELRASGYDDRTFSISSLTQDELNVNLAKAKDKSDKPRGARSGSSNDKGGQKGKPDKPPRRGVESEVLDPWD
ncbi:MAG TPA: protein kinase [Polyangiales bacterium]|nr:protein kinase [Polyangiales bacterium]